MLALIVATLDTRFELIVATLEFRFEFKVLIELFNVLAAAELANVDEFEIETESLIKLAVKILEKLDGLFTSRISQ